MKFYIIIAVTDGLIIFGSYQLAFKLRNFSSTPIKFLDQLNGVIFIYAVTGVAILFIVGFYRKFVIRANIAALFGLLFGVVLSSLLHFATPYILFEFDGYYLPRSIYLISMLLQIIMMGGVRLIWRIYTDSDMRKHILSAFTRYVIFSPPDITDKEIMEVVETMRSGWITTGPRTKEFERRIARFTGTGKAVCLSSATAAMEMTLRILGIGPGDEVITSAYTYTASASVIYHVGAKIVFIDTAPDSFEMDYSKLRDAITAKTKAVIPVDIGGKMCDYDVIFSAIESRKDLFSPSNKIQELFGRCIVIADSAHAFGATRNGKKSGQVADFTCFSFHAVKNLTTAEGGAAVWKSRVGLNNDWLYDQYMLYSLHGQTKDALSKSEKGSWEYDIAIPAYKCNMTDILAGFGMIQLDRYGALLDRRRKIIGLYDKELSSLGVLTLEHYGKNFSSTGHLYPVRIPGITEEQRNAIICRMADKKIAVNVHYKPLPMMTAYKNLGFDIMDYPNAYDVYKNEITLPLHTKLSDGDVEFVCRQFRKIVEEVVSAGTIREESFEQSIPDIR